MLATGLSQLRYAISMVRNGRIGLADVHRLIADMRRTAAEFGFVGDEQRELMTGVPLDPDVRAIVDGKRLRKVARAAAETPYYRELFGRHGLRPDELSVERLADWPVTPKDALRELPEAFVRPGSSPTVLVQTTGTTGRPTTIWLSDYELELLGALSAVSLLLVDRLDDTDVVHMSICSRASIAVLATVRACRLIGATCVMGGIIDPAVTLARLTTPVRLPGKKPKPSALNTYPSYLALLLQTAEDMGYHTSDFALEQIFCGGEVLSDALAERARRFFGARIVDGYAMTETVPVAGVVCGQQHLHWSPEPGHVELLDPATFAPVAPGELAMLVVTPFQPYRDTTQLFRLATGDLVRRLPEGALTCEMAGMPAATRLLGKAAHAGQAGARLLTTRDVLDVLEAEPELPLPVRYAVVPDADHARLHVLAAGVTAVRRDLIRSHLEDRVAAARLPISDLVLHADDTDLPPTTPVRADLIEHSFADLPRRAPSARVGLVGAQPAVPR